MIHAHVLSDFYTLSQTKLFENYTLKSNQINNY